MAVDPRGSDTQKEMSTDAYEAGLRLPGAGRPGEPDPTRPAPLVLVADDDDDILALVEFRLQRSGYEVITAHDGVQALQLADARSPDVFVLDVSMPGLSGLEVTRHLREGGPFERVPIILLTAAANERDIAAGLEEGADAYVTKPFSPQELLTQVATVLAAPARR
jgi:DNA-binding response OmpR family regulator